VKRTRWGIHEILKAIGIAERYQRASGNAEFSRRRLGNEIEALRWDSIVKESIKEWETMGLGEIIPDIKRIFTG